MKIATLTLCIITSIFCVAGGITLIVIVPGAGSIVGSLMIVCAAFIIGMYLGLIFMEKNPDKVRKFALISLKKRYARIRRREERKEDKLKRKQNPKVESIKSAADAAVSDDSEA